MANDFQSAPMNEREKAFVAALNKQGLPAETRDELVRMFRLNAYLYYLERLADTAKRDERRSA